MRSGVGIHNPAHLAHLELEGGLLEGFLHLPGAEETEVPHLLEAAAVRPLLATLAERVHQGLPGEGLKGRKKCMMLSIAKGEIGDAMILPLATDKPVFSSIVYLERSRPFPGSLIV